VPLPFDPENPHGPRRPPAPEGMSDVERLLAYEEIRQLVARYTIAMDSRDLAAMADCFVEDVRDWRGRVGRHHLLEALEWGFRRGLGGEVLFTLNGTHVINLLDADRAHGTLYAHAQLGDRERWIHQTVVYQDDYERRDGVWYFAHRDHHLVYGMDVAERPLDQPPANWPQSIVGLGTMPYGWRTWREFTGKETLEEG
jgi:hypothetical protein